MALQRRKLERTERENLSAAFLLLFLFFFFFSGGSGLGGQKSYEFYVFNFTLYSWRSFLGGNILTALKWHHGKRRLTGLAHGKGFSGWSFSQGIGKGCRHGGRGGGAPRPVVRPYHPNYYSYIIFPFQFFFLLFFSCSLKHALVRQADSLVVLTDVHTTAVGCDISMV